MNAQLLELIRSTLSDIAYLISTAHGRYGFRPATGSKAECERLSCHNNQAILTAHSQAFLALLSCTNHIQAITRTITEPVLGIAPWTLLRASLETSAIALWLADPQIDVQFRIARSLNWRWNGMMQQKKFLEASKSHKPESSSWQLATHPDKRLTQIRQQAKEMRIAEITDSKGRLKGFGNQNDLYANITNLIKTQLNQEKAYRILSAVAHGHTWAAIALGLQKTGKSEGLHILEEFISDEGLTFLAVMPITWLKRPAKAYFSLFGWDAKEILPVIEAQERDLFQAIKDFQRNKK